MTDYELTLEEQVTPYIRRRMDKAEYTSLSLKALARSAGIIADAMESPTPPHWNAGLADLYKNDAAYLGLTMLTDIEVIERGLSLRPDARPVAYRPYKNRKIVPVYIAECHTLLGPLVEENELPF